MGEDVVECIGSRGCIVLSEYSGECADIQQEDVLPFLDIIGGLVGCWNKIFTHGWDTWPRQQTHFYLPGATEPEPLPWMTAWRLATRSKHLANGFDVGLQAWGERFTMSNKFIPIQDGISEERPPN
jgi:hypothetical protein